MAVLRVVIWPLAIVLIAIYLMRKGSRLTVQVLEANRRLEQVEAAERELELRLKQAAYDEELEARQAKLRQQTAEANEATTLIDELHDDRREAKRRILAARTDAEVAQAAEHVRAEQEQNREGRSAGLDAVGRYGRLVQACKGSGRSAPDFGDFLRVTSEHPELF